MATRLYMSGTNAAVTPASGTYGGGQVWEIPVAGSAPAARLLARADNWPGAVAFGLTQSVAETSATNAQDVCILRFVSDPLVGAQSIAGTLKGQNLFVQSNNAANSLPQIMAKVISNDGATLRGTLYGGDSRTTNVDEITATTRNWKVPAAGVSPVALSSVSALNGDRILVEVGVRMNNTVTTSYTASLRTGTAASAGGANDLTENGTETTGTLNAWVEFSRDLIFTATGEVYYTPEDLFFY